MEDRKVEGEAEEKQVYKYDANGNQIERKWERRSPKKAGEKGRLTLQGELDSLTKLVYNGRNELIRAWSKKQLVEYQYGPDGLRRGKKVDGRNRYHVWDGANMVLEIGVNGVTAARYLRGLELIAREQDGKREYYHQNGHGDIILRTDSWGNALKAYEYDAFGVEQEREKLDTNPFRYCGEYWDEETETIYLRARNYRPAVGSFWSEDPARDGLHWYAYCAGNPVNFVDPSGAISIAQVSAQYKVGNITLDQLQSIVSYYSRFNPNEPAPNSAEAYWEEKVKGYRQISEAIQAEAEAAREAALNRRDPFSEARHQCTPEGCGGDTYDIWKLPQDVVTKNRELIDNLDPDLQVLAWQFLAKAQEQDIILYLTWGKRSVEDELTFPDGNAEDSKHLHGLAFDVMFWDESLVGVWPCDSMEFWRSNYGGTWDINDPRWSIIGPIGESVGLLWGGRFFPYDPPHFYINKEVQK